MSASEQTQFRCVVGAASCVVTPEVGTYHRMWGAAEHEVSIGVHRPLEAHVLFLADAAASSATDADASASAAGADASASAAGAAAAGEAIAYISIDICMLMEHDFQRIRPIVASASGLEPPQLLFCCTHTHAAGLMDSRRSGQPGGEKIEPYLQRLAAAVGRAVKEAYDGRVAGWGQLVRGRCSLAHARDQRLDDGRHVVGLAGPADDAMICGRFSDLGAMIAVGLSNSRQRLLPVSLTLVTCA